MVFKQRFGLSLQIVACATLLSPCFAQQPASDQAQQPTAQTPAEQNAPAAPANGDQVPPPGQPSAQPQQAFPQQKPPPQEPYIIEDGGLSIEPIYWLNRAQPALLGGNTNTGIENLSYPGNSNYGLGGELSMPAGRSDTLRLSYFRLQGNANSTANQPTTIFGEAYDAGDYLNASYTIQNAKLSWDYLGYTWYKPSGKIRLKELYEVQYTTISTTVVAPFVPVTTDSSGNVNNNVATGSKSLILPTFGLGLEEALGHHFRWEVKGSGFGIPHHSDMWDAEASIAVRFGQVEILGGEKAYHFKTSTASDEYFIDTLSGAYVGLRYYWGRQQ